MLGLWRNQWKIDELVSWGCDQHGSQPGEKRTEQGFTELTAQKLPDGGAWESDTIRRISWCVQSRASELGRHCKEPGPVEGCRRAARDRRSLKGGALTGRSRSASGR